MSFESSTNANMNNEYAMQNITSKIEIRREVNYTMFSNNKLHICTSTLLQTEKLTGYDLKMKYL